LSIFTFRGPAIGQKTFQFYCLRARGREKNCQFYHISGQRRGKTHPVTQKVNCGFLLWSSGLSHVANHVTLGHWDWQRGQGAKTMNNDYFVPCQWPRNAKFGRLELGRLERGRRPKIGKISICAPPSGRKHHKSGFLAILTPAGGHKSELWPLGARPGVSNVDFGRPERGQRATRRKNAISGGVSEKRGAGFDATGSRAC